MDAKRPGEGFYLPHEGGEGGANAPDGGIMQITKFQSIDSTNTEVKRRIKLSQISNGEVIVAEIQTAGRGQFDRSWDSNQGGLYFSIYRNDLKILPENDPLTLNIAKAIQKTLKTEFGLVVDIKEPNDIYFQGKKLAGILVEAISSGQPLSHVIMGIGINVDNEVSQDLKKQAISLKEILGREIDLDELLKKLIRDLSP